MPTPFDGRLHVLIDGDAPALVAGRLLAELGADVVIHEPASGHPARKLPPFVPNGESLRWWFLTAGCRSVDDASTVTPDITIVTKQPGTSYVKPEQGVLVVISPFGLNGARSEWPASDLTIQALGGLLWLAGDADRPPTPIAEPQATIVSGGHAADAALLAWASGEPQIVDLSQQAAVAWATHPTRPLWHLQHEITRRSGDRRPFGAASRRLIFPCADGYVAVQGVLGREWPAFLDWIALDGLDAPLRTEEWTKLASEGGIVPGATPDAVLNRLDVYLLEFFGRHTKRELYEGAQARRIMIFPVNTIEDIANDPHLAARSYFVPATVPGEDRQIPVNGPLVQFSRTPANAGRGPARNEAVAWPKPEPVYPFLKNLRVLDFAWVGVGPLITSLLAMHGADVIRVETTSRPDILRITGPYLNGKPDSEGSGYFKPLNPSKRDISVDLSNKAGKNLILKLAGIADCVTESFTPRVLNSLGLDYATLSKHRPDLVMMSLTMAGQAGPDRNILGFGTVLQAAAGFPAITGWPDRTPVAVGVPYTDWTVPFLAFPSLVAALDHRRRTGEGQYLDCSQYEASQVLLGPAHLNYVVNGVVPGRTGLAHPWECPHGVYLCADGRYIAVSCPDDVSWKKLATVVPGTPISPDTGRDERKANEVSIDGWLSSAFSGMTAENAQKLLIDARIPAGIALSPEETASDISLLERGYGSVLDPNFPIPYDPPSFSISNLPTTLTPAPVIGQHNDEVLGELLGLSDDDIAELWAAGALV